MMNRKIFGFAAAMMTVAMCGNVMAGEAGGEPIRIGLSTPILSLIHILTNATGDPMRSTMTLIMYLNKHLYSKNYGMAGALSVLMFLLTGVLSILIFKVTAEKKDR